MKLRDERRETGECIERMVQISPFAFTIQFMPHRSHSLQLLPTPVLNLVFEIVPILEKQW